MSAILNSLNAHNFLIFQPILMSLVLKFMVYRALSLKTYLLSGLRSPLTKSTFYLKLGCILRGAFNKYMYTEKCFKIALVLWIAIKL